MRRERNSPAKCDLSSHHSLSLDDEEAIAALAVLPSTKLLMSFEAGNDTVITTASTFWSPEKSFHRRFATDSWVWRRGGRGEGASQCLPRHEHMEESLSQVHLKEECSK